MDTSRSDLLRSADALRLSRLLRVEGGNERPWSPAELAAVLRHQLDAPVAMDFTPTGGSPGKQEAMRGGDIRSFADLLHAPKPPLGLLQRVKDFAKANCGNPDAVLPHDVAAVLYYAAIVAAQLHAAGTISRLDIGELRRGLEWAVALDWVDMRTRGLLSEGLAWTAAEAGPS
jgi:hypothetical protein